MSIDGTLSCQLQLNDRRSLGINTLGNLPVNATASTPLSDGVGANQANILYQASLAMTSGAYALDVYSATTDSYGTALATVRIKGIYIRNTSSHTFTFGAGTAPITSLLNAAGTITLPPGAWFLAASPNAAGWTVTATTADRINFVGTTTDSFEVVIFGGKT